MLLSWCTGEVNADVDKCAKVDAQRKSVTSQAMPLFTTDEVHMLVHTWERATSRSDVGADLVARLLNDRRSNFQSLLVSRGAYHIPLEDDQLYTVDIVRNGYPRASNVADGVANFFKKMMINMKEGDYDEDTLATMSKENGALHYHMKVWFQAENWLCVKRCVIAAIMSTDKHYKDGSQQKKGKALNSGFKQKPIGDHVIVNLNSRQRFEEYVWMKLLKFVIHKMKEGFLETALKTESKGCSGSPLTLTTFNTPSVRNCPEGEDQEEEEEEEL